MTRNPRTKRRRVLSHVFIVALTFFALFPFLHASADIAPCVYGMPMTNNNGTDWTCVAPLDTSQWPADPPTGTPGAQPTAAMILQEKAQVQNDFSHGEIDSTEETAELAVLNGDLGATSPARDADAFALPAGSTSGDPNGEAAAENPNLPGQDYCFYNGCFWRFNNDSMVYDSYTVHYGWRNQDGLHEIGTMFFHQRWSLHPPPPRDTARNYVSSTYESFNFGASQVYMIAFGGVLADGAARESGGLGHQIGDECVETRIYDLYGSTNIADTPDPYCARGGFSQHDHNHSLVTVWEAKDWQGINFYCEDSSLVSHTWLLGYPAPSANYYYHTFGAPHQGFSGNNPVVRCGADADGYAYVPR